MSDKKNMDDKSQNTPDAAQAVTPKRLFKTGATVIEIDDAMAHMDNEAIRNVLKLQYPELAHATLREVPQEPLEDGTAVLLVEALAKPGRKG